MPLPWIEPIAPQKVPAPADLPGLAWELKHDGFRGLLYIEHRRGRFLSRTGRDMPRFQSLADALAKELSVPTLILDGELVVLDDEGRSQFNALMRRDPPAVFSCFDILWSGGGDLRQRPLRDRKGQLQGMWPHGTDHMLIADYVVGAGEALFAEVCRRDLEGVVGKPLASPYALVRGRSPWFKVLNPEYSQKRGRAEVFNRRR